MGTDRYTAPPEALGVRRGPGPPTLRDCLHAWLRRPSPPLLLGAVLLAAVLRAVQDPLGWRDAVVAAGVLLVTPPAEWAIHVYVLHSRPLRVAGRRIELLSTREHRAHHQAPAELDRVLLNRLAVAASLPLIAGVIYALSFPVALGLGGDRLSGASTALLVSWSVLAAYEWVHFLIHTPYRPRSRAYRAIWRNHRLHHYKNERYWFGVTSTFGDRMMGTLRDPRSVPKSRTARTLRGA